MTAAEKLATAVWESDRHLDTLTEALQDWKAAPAASYAELEADRSRIRLVDQILFRFLKLQDALGERLIPATLAILDEPFEEWPMRDRLNRLEKLTYIDVEQWLSWREIRNRLAHEYPDASEVRFAAIRAAIQAAEELCARYRVWRAKLESAGLLGK